MFEICCFLSYLERIKLSPIGPLFGIDKENVFYSSRFYQNWLHFFARSFYITMYFGGKSFVSEKLFNSFLLLSLTIYLGYQMRDARFIRGKAIKNEIDRKVKNGLKKANHYHCQTQWIGTISTLLMFFSAIIMKDNPNFSLLLFFLHFVFGFVTSEAIYCREQSTYYGK